MSRLYLIDFSYTKPQFYDFQQSLVVKLTFFEHIQ